MANPLIQTVPTLGPITVGQKGEIYVSPITFPAGNTLADYTSFVLVVRENPYWPRTGTNKVNADTADPSAWTAVMELDGTVDGSALSFLYGEADSAALSPGVERNVFQVWGIAGAGGPVPIVQPTWVTVLPDLRA